MQFLINIWIVSPSGVDTPLGSPRSTTGFNPRGDNLLFGKLILPNTAWNERNWSKKGAHVPRALFYLLLHLVHDCIDIHIVFKIIKVVKNVTTIIWAQKDDACPPSQLYVNKSSNGIMIKHFCKMDKLYFVWSSQISVWPFILTIMITTLHSRNKRY